MSDSTDIRSTVVGNGAMTGLIGDRIYPVVLPPDPTLPAVTYMLVSQVTERTQTDEQYRWPRWRFRIWSLIYGDLEPIAVAIAAIFGYQDQTPFQASWIQYPGANVEGHETDTHRYWRTVDVVAFAPAGSVSQ